LPQNLDNQSIYTLETVGCTFGYGGHNVLKNVGFALKAGDFAALTGANGSGKSTLLKLILGELSLQGGGIKLFGRSHFQFKDWGKLAYVPQNSMALCEGFPATVREIVALGLYPRTGLLGRIGKEQRLAADTALERVGMGGYGSSAVSRLSGGQRQRVMLAKALASGAKLLILDEPFSGLDGQSTDTMYALLAIGCKEGLSVLMVSHDMQGAARHCSRILCLEQGSLIELTRSQVEYEQRHRHTHLHAAEGG